MQFLLCQRLTVFPQRHAAFNAQLQLGPVIQRLGQLAQLIFGVSVQRGYTGLESDQVQLFITANQTGQQREGGGDRLGDDIGDGGHHYAAEAETWAVEIS